MCSKNLLITLHLVKEAPTYNLIEAVPEIYQQIFSYLDFNDRLNASLVCKSWYKFIGSSSSLMKKCKVKIQLKDIKESREVCEIINNSCRKIFHLEISYENDFEGRIQQFWDPELGVLPCPLIEHLQRNSFLIKHLISLSILTNEVKEITNILRNCVNLQELELKAMLWKEVDWMEITTIPIFKLKTLTITSDSTTASGHQGLEKFLRTQTESIENLSFNRGFLESESIQTVMQMKRIKCLQISDTVFSDIKNSGNLKTLEELQAYVEQNVLENSLFLRSFPNLKILKLRHLEQRSIEIIGNQLKNLKELHVKSIDFNDISNPVLFHSLTLIKIEEFVDFYLQEAILQQVAEESTNFVQCLYDEICKPPHINWDKIN